MMPIKLPDKVLNQFFHEIPKTEIHLHLEALATIPTIYSLINKHQLNLTAIKSEADLKQKFQVRNLDQFVDLFMNVIQPCFQDEQDFQTLIKDARTYLIRNAIYYAEIFFAPTRFLKMGLSFKDMLDMIEAEADIAFKDDGIDIRFLVDVSRSYGPENAMQNLDLTIQHPHERVIGIGLGGAEKNNPARDYKKVFEKARANGLHTVAHAGEDVGPQSIRDTVEILQAERIGHGISAYLDSELMDLLAEKAIPLEVCPTSNVFTQRFVKRLEDHPVTAFFNHGIQVTINTDDPVIFGVELADELENVHTHCQLTIDNLITIIENGLQATFMPGSDKLMYLGQSRLAIKNLRAKYSI